MDPSLTGFGIVALKDGACIAQDLFSTSSKDSHVERYNYLVERSNDFILTQVRAVRPGTIYVVREDYAYAKNDTADTPLKELGGALSYALWIKGITINRIGITSVKKATCGKGTAKKSEIMKAVYKRYGFDGGEDESDAFAVAMTAWLGLTKPQTMTKQESEVAASLPQLVPSLTGRLP